MKYFLCFCFVISVSFAFECSSSEWFRFRNKCYLIDITKDYSFQENVDFCESLNATSVSIHSEEENNFIKSESKAGFSYWLGIRQVDFGAKTYAWLDGSLYNYSNWYWRGGKKSCAGAYVDKGKWYDGINCEARNHAFCQIDFHSSFYQMRSRIKNLSQELKNDRKANEIRLNETIARLDIAFNTTNDRLDKTSNATSALITNLNSTFEAQLNEKENRISKLIEKLEDSINLLNLSMTLKTLDYDAVLTNKDFQMNKSLADLRLFIERLNQSVFKMERQSIYANEMLERHVYRNKALDWIFGVLLIFIFCTLIYFMCKVFNRMRWLTNEMKSSKGVMFVSEPTTDNINESCKVIC